ncbi:MAG: tyrosine-type recombinase/integrase [Magnetococcales bacterium]|nr:tyrosine-type recombinase/integrase [Magnetococcales bacterium]
MKIKLTKRFIDSAKAEKAGEKSKHHGKIIDTYYFDSDLIGFGIKVTPPGRKIYFVQYRIHNRKRRLSIGTHGSPWTPDTARTEASRLLGIVSHGGDPAEDKQEAKKVLTVADLCELYLEEGALHKKESTLYVDRRRIQRHIVPVLGKKLADRITRADIERFLIAVADGKTATDVKTGFRGRAIVKGGQGTANRAFALLRAILSFAVGRGIRSDNPAFGIKKFKEGRKDRFLSQQELARLGATLKEVEQEGVNPIGIAAIRLIIFSGCRKSEILTLEWKHVDFENMCLRLPDSKTGFKVVPLGAPAMELLSTLPRIQDSPYAFPGEKPGHHIVGVPKIFNKVRERAKLENVSLHTLRHAFASVGVGGGASLLVVGAILGHSSEAMTARYGHLAADPVKQAAERISNDIAAAMNGKTKENVVPMKEAAQ